MRTSRIITLLFHRQRQILLCYWQFSQSPVGVVFAMPPDSSQSKETYDVFLCHNGADKDWARSLAEQLESETFSGMKKGRFLRVFFDEWDIDVGQNVLLNINRALTASRYVAIIISPEMLDAPWPSLEWTHIVSDDPTNRNGRVIPLFLRDYSDKLLKQAELPAPFKALNWIDFRRPTDFNRSFLKLVRKIRDEAPSRGRKRASIASQRMQMTPLHSPSDEMAAAPDRVQDFLLANLLPVQDYPKTIWFAPTNARLPKDVYDIIEQCDDFVLREKSLLTFADLSISDEPLRAAIDTGKIESRTVASWKSDAIRWLWIVALLNRCLRSHLGSLPIKRDEKGRFFFRPTRELGARVWKNGIDPERTVAAQKTTPSGETFWVHQGARLAFQTLGELLFLCIEPCYVFTSDGNQTLEGKTVGPLSIKWGGKERNAAILRHIVFWARTLAKQSRKIEITTGGQPIQLLGIPALARTGFGIEFDHIAVGTLLNQFEDELQLAAESQSTLSEDFVDDDDEEQCGNHE